MSTKIKAKSKVIVKQKFLNKTLTRTKVTNNIIKCYNKTSEDHKTDWYEEAYKFCEELSKESNSLDTMQVAGIVAAVSPMKSWDQNKKLAREIVLDGKRSGTFGACIGKCESIIDLKESSKSEIDSILKGNKIKAFFNNIYFYKSKTDITIDRHAIEIAVNEKLTDREKILSDSQYEFFKHCYSRAAEKLNLRPSMVQSTTWVYWRENRKSLSK